MSSILLACQASIMASVAWDPAALSYSSTDNILATRATRCSGLTHETSKQIVQLSNWNFALVQSHLVQVEERWSI